MPHVRQKSVDGTVCRPGADCPLGADNLAPCARTAFRSVVTTSPHSRHIWV